MALPYRPGNSTNVKRYRNLTLSFENVRQVITWSLRDFDSYVNRKRYPVERRRRDGLSMRARSYDDRMVFESMRREIAEALAAAPQRS